MATLSIGDPMPPIPNLPGADWRSYSDEHFANAEVLVVAFICNHCPFVMAMEGRIKEFFARYSGQGMAMMTLNSNDDTEFPEDSYEQMVLRARTHEYRFPYLRDADQSVAALFGATHTPEFFVFDRERRLRYHGAFDDEWKDPDSATQHYLAWAVEALLEGRDVEQAETRATGCSIKWTQHGGN